MQLVHLGEQRDDAYRALGRYFVLFSSLIAVMRDFVAAQIARDEEARRLTRLAFGSLQAQQVTDAFFSICRTVAEPSLDADELAIEKCLRENHVNAEIRWRNVVAHGDWFVAEWSRGFVDIPPAPPATLVRVQAGKASEPVREEDLKIEDIDAYGDRVELLRAFIWEFGMICTRTVDYDPSRSRPGVRIRDRFELTGSANARRVTYRPSNSPELWPNSAS